MPDQNQKSIRRELRDQQGRLASHAYPGDLAEDVLSEPPKPALAYRFRTPAIAVALLGIGVTIAIGLLYQSEPPQPSNLTHSQQPEPEQQAQEIAAQPQAPPTVAQTRTDPVVSRAIPEIDRELLPVQRNGKATWLASVNRHTQQIEKQSRLAEHPNLGKRKRLSLSAPTRRTIDRTLDRPLLLKPAPKPERNS